MSFQQMLMWITVKTSILTNLNENIFIHEETSVIYAIAIAIAIAIANFFIILCFKKGFHYLTD